MNKSAQDMEYFNKDCFKLTRIESLAFCLFISSLYVTTMYLFVPNLPRNLPIVVVARIRNAIIYTFIVLLMVYYLYIPNSDNCPTYFELIGFNSKNTISASVYSMLLTTILFIGPIIQYKCEGLSVFSSEFWFDDNDAVISVRTLIIAPLSEEIVYRGCIFPLLYSSFNSSAVFICPWIFGLAHIHHLSEWFKETRDMNSTKEMVISLLQKCVIIILQCIITSIFGLYSTFLLWRTKSIVPPIVCHALCNGYGFPPINRIYGSRYLLLIVSTYIAGFIAFCALLYRFTDYTN